MLFWQLYWKTSLKVLAAKASRVMEPALVGRLAVCWLLVYGIAEMGALIAPDDAAVRRLLYP